MKENSIEKDEEILNNIKTYMQENIDKGYHKFIYNDLGYDEKCIDVINAIEHILSDYKRVLKENESWKSYSEEIEEEQIEKNNKNCELEFEVEKLQKENEYYKECLEVVSKHLDNIDYDQILFAIYEYYISKQKVKDKIEEEIKYHEKNILDIENITMLKGKTAKEEAEIEFNKYVIVVLKKILQELTEEREEK